MAIKGGLTLLQMLQKLFGTKNVSRMMGKTTNVQSLGKGLNNPFAATFSKRYLKENPNGIDEAAQSILENMQFAFGNKNPKQIRNFQNNVNTLYDLKFPAASPEAKVVDLGSKKQVTGKGLESLKKDMGLPEGVVPDSPMGRMLESANRLGKTDLDMGAKAYSAGEEANRAAVIREIILEDGRLDLPKEIVDGLMGRSERPINPMEVFNALYKRDVKKLDKLDNFVFKGEEVRKDSKQVAKDFLDDEAGFDLNKNAPYRYKKPEDDLATKLKKADADDDLPEMAYGGIAGQLHLNEGGRANFQTGLSVLPQIGVTKSSSTPVSGIDETIEDRNYGVAGSYQGNNAYVGGNISTGNVNVKVKKDGETVFSDTMPKDKVTNLYMGLGQKEGNNIQVGTDGQGNYIFNIKTSFADGGRAAYGKGKLVTTPIGVLNQFIKNVLVKKKGYNATLLDNVLKQKNGEKLLKQLYEKEVGKVPLTTADKVAVPKSTVTRDMFKEANERFNTKIKERTSAEEVGIDNLFDKDGVLDKDAVLRDITKSVEKTKKSKIVKTKTPDKDRSPTAEEIEDYMDELPHGGELDWTDLV